MTATMNGNQIYTYRDLQYFLDWIVQATECRIHDYDYESKECSEDPIAQLFGTKNTIDWLMEHPAYCRGGELAGYLVVIFNRDGFSCEIIF